MAIVILGASGLVGRRLVHDLEEAGTTVVGTVHQDPRGGSFRRLDVHDGPALTGLLEEVSPQGVVLATRFPRTADYTPEQSGLERALAERLVRWSEASGARLVLLSTASVFAGGAERYREDDPPDPTSRYGQTRAEMERIVGVEARHLVVRLNRTDGFRPGIATRFEDLWRRLQSDEPVALSEGFVHNPLGVRAAVRAVAHLWTSAARGTWHVAGGEVVSELEHGRRLARLLGSRARAPLVPQDGARAFQLVLATDRIAARLAGHGLPFPPPLDDDLSEILEDAPDRVV